MTQTSRVVFDTNAYSYLFRGNPVAAEVLQCASHIVVSVIVIAELLTGFGRGNRYESNLHRLEQFLALPRVSTVAPTRETVFICSNIVVDLESVGRMIPTNDVWIAALAMQHFDQVFSFDDHFSRVQGLRFGKNVTELML
jgi:tRNA(fMet)-specific endonuclease VapC